MHTNVLGPMRLLAPLAEALAPGGRLAHASRRGWARSAARTEAGSLLYRRSKAAVNSVLKDASLSSAGARSASPSIPAGSAPTWAARGAAIDVGTSVAGMRRVIASLTPADSGCFRNHDGAPIAW